MKSEDYQEKRHASAELYPKRFCVGCDETNYMKFGATNMNLCTKCLVGLNLGGDKK